MVERLEAMIEAARKLPEAEQEALAAQWEDILEEREWEAIVSKPHVRDTLKRMAVEALKEDAAGETECIEGDAFV